MLRLILLSTLLILQVIPPQLVAKDYTDGTGVLPVPAGLSQAEVARLFEKGKKACAINCQSRFGTLLGIADGAAGKSNCSSACIDPEYSFLNLTTGEITVHTKDPKDSNLHYIGVIYQCIEYARKWWMINKGISFNSVDSAYEIFYLPTIFNIRTKATTPLARSVNGSAKRPPRKGDLVIYYPDRTIPRWFYGHVAVVVDTNLEQGNIAIAEQNFLNKAWDNPKAYSRKLQLIKNNDHYTLEDPSEYKKNNSGGIIAGWVYPYEDEVKDK